MILLKFKLSAVLCGCAIACRLSVERLHGRVIYIHAWFSHAFVFFHEACCARPESVGIEQMFAFKDKLTSLPRGGIMVSSNSSTFTLYYKTKETKNQVN